jgi:hypothetical protein
MCMQCMITAMSSGAVATGTRTWLASRRFSWMTPERLRRVTVLLIAAALIASATLVSGSSAPPA